MRYFHVLAVKKDATYADLVALPPHVVGEIIDGELIASPRPAAVRAVAASRLTMEIGGPFDRGKGGPGGWVILSEPELHIVDQVLVPDLAGWRRQRMSKVPEVPYFELVSDWLCEVLSPSTAKVDRSQKMRHYAAAGVRHVWLVDPAATTLEVDRLDGEAWRLVHTYAGGTTVRPEPFDAIDLDLAASGVADLLFREPQSGRIRLSMESNRTSVTCFGPRLWQIGSPGVPCWAIVGREEPCLSEAP